MTVKRQRGTNLPRFGIYKQDDNVYIGKLSRNYAGDYVNGIRIDLSNCAGLLQVLANTGLNSDPVAAIGEAFNITEACTEGIFRFPQYTIKGAVSIDEKGYGRLKKILHPNQP